MGLQGTDYSWLPAHQEQAVYTLAHIDSIIGQLTDVLYEFQNRGVFDLASRHDDTYSYVFISGVQPLPAAIPRLFADAATQLRAALEHALFAQVEFELGTTLDDAGLNARRVEMPAQTDADLFARWLQDGARKKIAPLQEGQELVSRIRRLQPYWHVDPSIHPMKLIAEHTNLAKHRAPAVAVTRVGPVIPEYGAHELDLAKPRSDGGPAQAGDVLARGPRAVIIPIGIYPDISVQRPHTLGWNILAHELNIMFEWVRTEALPILITGSSTVRPLPPTIDITVGYESAAVALEHGQHTSSFARNGIRLQAHSGREDLADLISEPRTSLPRADAEKWIAILSDQEVVDEITQLGNSAGSLPAVMRAIKELVDRATAFLEKD
jgi:hypothetical protein